MAWADRCQKRARLERERDVPTGSKRKEGEDRQDEAESHGGVV